MEQMEGKDNKKNARRSKNTIFKEAFFVNDDHTYSIDQFKSNDGELPLFYSSSPHLSSKASDLNFDYNPIEPKWPLGSQESGSWASSFRFELDTQDDDRLQAILKGDEQIPEGEANLGQKLSDCHSLMDSSTIDNGSFRFTRNEVLQSGNEYGKLKSPKQLGSFGFTKVFNANESQGYDDVQSGGRLDDGLARIKVAVNDNVITSPRRDVLQRLRDLKAHPSSPKLSPQDIAKYQKEKAKMNIMRDDIQQSFQKPFLKNEYLGVYGSLKPISHDHCKFQTNISSEQEIMEFKEKKQLTPLRLQGTPQRIRRSPSPMHSTTLKLRFKDNKSNKHSMQEKILVKNSNNPCLDHVHSKHATIPFKWEDEPDKPKTIVAAIDRVLARRLSRDGIDYMELQLDSQKGDANSSIENGHSEKEIDPDALELSLSSSNNVDQRSGSHRYYGREYLRGLSRDGSSRMSTKRFSSIEKETLIDLDGSAAAKFLVEAFESPSRSRGSSPTFLVPFKWEDAPGKAKVETIVQRPDNMLQLPPRLALPSLSRPGSFSSGKHRASSSFGGFFMPCLAMPMSVHQKEFTSSHSLPPRLLHPPKRLTRFGLISLCNSTPKEGCQVWMSKSKTSISLDSKKSSIDAQQIVDRKCTNLSISQLKMKSNEPSLSTQILCGPTKYTSETSGSSMMFSSGDLEDFTIQIQKSASKSSSNTSYENIEEDLGEFPEVATTKLVVDTILLDRNGAPTSSGYLNSQGKPLVLETLTKLQPKTTSSSPEASPRKPSRLAYTMPSVAEQLFASCSTSGRRQLLQDFSPRLLHQLSSRKHSRSHSSANILYQHLTSASEEKVVSPSSSYNTSIEIFSSSTNQHTLKTVVSKPPSTKPRRHIRLMSSIFKSFKRVLSKKTQSFKQSEPMLTYLKGGKSLAKDFRFKTT